MLKQRVKSLKGLPMVFRLVFRLLTSVIILIDVFVCLHSFTVKESIQQPQLPTFQRACEDIP